MTAATLSRLPLAAGGNLVGSLGRGGFWTFSRLLDAGFWGVSQFMRAPVAISATAAIVGFSVLAGSNALYFQHERHPAPLFFPAAKEAVVHIAPKAQPQPVLPAPRPHLVPTAFDLETTGSISRDAATPIASTDITEMQMKLVAMKLLSDTPDGIFGPRTAAAVRAFQLSAGLRPDGRLSPALLAAIRTAPLPQPAAAIQQSAAAMVAATPAVSGPIRPVPLAPLVAVPTPVASAAPAIIASTPVAPNPLASSPAEANAPASAPATAGTPSPVVASNAQTPADVHSVADTFAANSASTDAGANDQPPAVASPDSAAVATAPPDAATPLLSAAQRLAAQMGTLPPDAATEATIAATPGTDDSQGSTDPVLITKIQRGLASLGFLADKIDGVPGEGTAKAIRNFEVFYNYHITGLATHQLLGLLVQHGATI